MKRIFPLFLLVLCGCSVVSCDRVFPKLTWRWSKEATAQRESKREAETEKAMREEESEWQYELDHGYVK